MPPSPSFFAKIRERAFAPVDIASLVFFRVAFGLIMVWETILLRNQIAKAGLHPRFLFKYYGFSWVKRRPENGLQLHSALLARFAACGAAALWSRITATLLCLSCTYFFLLAHARYLH